MIGIYDIVNRYRTTTFILGSLLVFHLFDLFFIYFFPENLIYRHTLLSVNTANPSLIDILLTSFMQNGSYHLFRNMILVAVFGPYVEDRIGGIDTIIVFIFSASMGLIMYTIHVDLLWDAQSVVRGSSGGTIAFAGIGLSVIIDNMTDINWTLSSIISLIIIIHIELLKVLADPSIFSSSYPVMSAHVGGLIFGYILIIIINREGRYKSESSGRYDKL